MPSGIYIRTDKVKEQNKKNLTHRYEKGHKFHSGGEKGWFKKGDAHSKYWKGKKRDCSHLKEWQFKEGEHRNKETEFKKGEHPSLQTEFNKENRKYLIIPKRDTKIEIKIQNLLKNLEVEFITHQYMNIEHGYQCDIFIPSMNTVIECDGDYYHGNKKITRYNNLKEWQLRVKERDEIRTKELIEKGYKVIRLWEHEIKQMNETKLKDLLK